MTAANARMPAADADNHIEMPADDAIIRVTRAFAAPRALVWECYTIPAHLAHFWGPRDTITTATVDLRIGGLWRIDWRGADGSGFGYSSVLLEVDAPKRMVYRDAPDGWPGGLDGLPPIELHTVIALAESGGRTAVTVTVRFNSVALRDENARRGFTGMVVNGNDRLAEYLATLPPRR